MLLLHEFHRQKFLLPDKLRAKDRERLAKAAAALVEPKSEDNVEDEQEKPGILLMQANPHLTFAEVIIRLVQIL